MLVILILYLVFVWLKGVIPVHDLMFLLVTKLGKNIFDVDFTFSFFNFLCLNLFSGLVGDGEI
jgi:hypothetical protein